MPAALISNYTQDYCILYDNAHKIQIDDIKRLHFKTTPVTMIEEKNRKSDLL